MAVINNVPGLLARKFGGKDNINLTHVARDSGIAYSTVNAWAKGRVDRFDLDMIEKWCVYLDVEPGDIFTREKGKAEE